MGPDCAAKSEAIRTASARGVSGSTISELNVEYQRKCGEEDRFARQRASEQRSIEVEQQKTVLAQAAHAKSSKKALSERCFAMRDTLHSQKKRLDPADERSASSLKAFQERFNQECV